MPTEKINTDKARAELLDLLGDVACTNNALRRAARRLGQLYDKALAPIGLKATQVGLLGEIARLSAVDEQGGPTLQELAGRLAILMSALTHAMKPLVRDGLVLVQVDELDRRSRRVLLTDDGQRKYEEARVVSKQMAVRFDEAFGVEAACELRKAMDFIASDDFARALLGKSA